MNRTTLTLTAVTLMMLSFGLVLLPLAAPVRAETLGTWNSTSAIPQTVDTEGMSCVVSGSDIFCVGGFTDGAPTDVTYYASYSSSGIGTWQTGTDYPTIIYLPSCVAEGGYITCVGGLVEPGAETAAVYSAPISSSGIGAWTLTTPYPTDMEATSCVTNNSQITCIGGLTGIGFNTAATYHATIVDGVVGAWTQEASYPMNIEGQSCFETDEPSSTYVTCVGGQYNPLLSEDITPNAYVDSITNGILGSTWTPTTGFPYPLSFDPCWDYGATFSTTYTYCIAGYTESGGMYVYYSLDSSGALGAWAQTTAYPTQVTATLQCVSPFDGYFYCTGGEPAESASYYTQVGASTTSSSSSTTSSSSSTTSSTSTTTSSSTTSVTTSAVPICPSTTGGVAMPPGATFTDLSGNTWVAPSGSLGGELWKSYFFAGTESMVPPPMMLGWGGVYGTYAGQQGWVVTFYC